MTFLVGCADQARHGRSSPVGPDHHSCTMDAPALICQTRAYAVTHHDLDNLGPGLNVDPGRRCTSNEDRVEGGAAHRHAIANPAWVLGRTLRERASVEG